MDVQVVRTTYARENKNVNGWINGCTSRQSYARKSKNVNGWINGCTSRQSPNCTASSRAGVKATKKSAVDGTKVKCDQDGQEEGDGRGME